MTWSWKLMENKSNGRHILDLFRLHVCGLYMHYHQSLLSDKINYASVCLQLLVENC